MKKQKKPLGLLAGALTIVVLGSGYLLWKPFSQDNARINTTPPPVPLSPISFPAALPEENQAYYPLSVGISAVKQQTVPATEPKVYQPESPPAAPVTISTTILIENTPYLLHMPPNSSAYDTMKWLADQGVITFTTKDFGSLGYLIESINSKQNNYREHIYWVYCINNKKATIGVSNYLIQPDDIIAWKYEPSNQQTAACY